MPPPHHMSPSPSPVVMEPPARMSTSSPIPPPPIISEEANVETPTTSETSSETIPSQSAARAKEYVYRPSNLRERGEQQPQRSRTPTPLSPGSTRMSDYGILSSPQVDQRRMRAPVQAQHFEIERSNTPTREKMNRSWSLRKKKEVMRAFIMILLFCRMLINFARPRRLHLSGPTSVLRRFLLPLWKM